MTLKRRDRLMFCGLFLLAVVLRALAFNPFAIHHPDEALQYLEQAHRLAFGYGVEPWEYRYGIRNWLMPLLLAPPMALGDLLDPQGTLYLGLPRAFVALLNLAPVAAAWAIGAWTSRRAAVLAMLAVAVWVECILFSVSVLSEVLASSCFMAAAALLAPRARPGMVAAAGALLTLAGLIRFQYGPAIAVFAVVAAGRDWRLWRALVAGAVPVLALGAIADLATGLVPFSWVVANVRLNLVENRMGDFGGASRWIYVWSLLQTWGPAAIVLPLLAGLVWREHRALVAAAAVNLLFHQLIGHREYRFVWLTLQIVVVLAAIGSATLVDRLPVSRRTVGTILVAGLWASASLALFLLQPVYRTVWRDPGYSSRLGARAMRDPEVCGLAVPRHHNTEFGYAMLHRDKPIFVLADNGPESLTAPGSLAAAFNAAIAWGPGPPGFARAMCVEGAQPGACLYRRPGGCSIDPAARRFLYQQVLLRADR